ncbi:MAG TPA: hypothetical protein VJS44_19170 [Pyrinomonadaceae bacterium]|nr:hypothetical protein [Pyrinomonadaceae bacterium]
MKKLTATVMLFVSLSICTLTLPQASAASPELSLQQKSWSEAALPLMVAPDDPEATYQGARIVHNVSVNGRKGMRIHAKFTVRYGLDVPCRMIAYFYFADGRPLKSSDRNYTTVDGNVSASVRFTPAYDPAVYNDLQLFIPYEALNMEAGDEYDLKFYLGLYDNEGERFFGKSGWYPFHLTVPEE